MNGKLFFSFFISLFLFISLKADDTLFIIKVNGAYGIINKGANQGMKEGEVFYIRREGRAEPICKVKILRTTANRSAIEQVSEKKIVTLLRGDQLFLESELQQHKIVNTVQTQMEPASEPKAEISYQTREERNSSKQNDRGAIKPNTSPQKASFEKSNSMDAGQTSTRSFTKYSAMSQFKNPWITLEAGSIFPNGHFSELYSNSLQFNANYLVSLTDDVNLGLDISSVFLRNTDLTADFESSSMLTVAVLFQKFFGDYFFMEAGGGVFRPKVTLISVDNVKSSYTETNFGVIAGGGLFIPTSNYAGLIMKGKLHSYFDHYSKNYFGITGGFRFKIR